MHQWVDDAKGPVVRRCDCSTSNILFIKSMHEVTLFWKELLHVIFKQNIAYFQQRVWPTSPTTTCSLRHCSGLYRPMWTGLGTHKRLLGLAPCRRCNVSLNSPRKGSKHITCRNKFGCVRERRIQAVFLSQELRKVFRVFHFDFSFVGSSRNVPLGS